jgi:hypothetical protein
LDDDEESLTTEGVRKEEIGWESFFKGKASKDILAFYSCCKNKPYRF